MSPKMKKQKKTEKRTFLQWLRSKGITPNEKTGYVTSTDRDTKTHKEGTVLS